MTDRPVSPDPIGDPSAYQRYLLELLGEDDPSVVQAGTPAALREVAAEAGGELRQRPEPSEWSVHECIAHIADAEIVMSGRYRWVLAQDDPPLIGYDQDLWVEQLHKGEAVEELLEVFEPLRRANVALWDETAAARRNRVGMHAERGPESYDLSFRMIAGHDRFHIAQARRALETLRGA